MAEKGLAKQKELRLKAETEIARLKELLKELHHPYKHSYVSEEKQCKYCKAIYEKKDE